MTAASVTAAWYANALGYVHVPALQHALLRSKYRAVAHDSSMPAGRYSFLEH
jgi:hypothetical protein